MIRSRVLMSLVTATMVSVTAVILLFGPLELSLLTLVAYLIWRVAKIALVIWGMKLLARWRRPALAPAA